MAHVLRREQRLLQSSLTYFGQAIESSQRRRMDQLGTKQSVWCVATKQHPVLPSQCPSNITSPHLYGNAPQWRQASSGRITHLLPFPADFWEHHLNARGVRNIPTVLILGVRVLAGMELLLLW
ncbi:uncharacterized protein LOC135112561 [Scylla paramamosain]|uniref:uncharacterized protein LOC135112561 n=1 Tax=Scylla paramamosain TaxID=85552 RepID=UPI003082BD15